MPFETPGELYYAETHEWLRITDSVGTVGITDFAQDELGDVIFIEFDVEIGDVVTQGNDFGTIESMKADAGLYAPVTGEISDINDELETSPELVNDDPYRGGWLIELSIADEAELETLLSADEYRDQTA